MVGKTIEILPQLTGCLLMACLQSRDNGLGGAGTQARWGLEHRHAGGWNPGMRGGLVHRHTGRWKTGTPGAWITGTPGGAGVHYMLLLFLSVPVLRRVGGITIRQSQGFAILSGVGFG